MSRIYQITYCLILKNANINYIRTEYFEGKLKRSHVPFLKFHSRSHSIFDHVAPSLIHKLSEKLTEVLRHLDKCTYCAFLVKRERENVGNFN